MVVKKYEAIGGALSRGEIAIGGLSEFLPVVEFSRLMGLNYNTICKRLLDPQRFTVRDISQLAEILGISRSAVFAAIERACKLGERY